VLGVVNQDITTDVYVYVTWRRKEKGENNNLLREETITSVLLVVDLLTKIWIIIG
jgi:hypothetical protein